MSRVCEICGRFEKHEDESTEAIDEMEMLFVCDRCLDERQTQADLSL